MYNPRDFVVDDLEKLHEAIERHSFAILVSGAGEQLAATHLPLLIERTAGPRGTLVGHMARANPQWQAAAGQNVLAIFSGPHAYISPRWYQSPLAVPTWNYVAVHAAGQLEVIEDRAKTWELLKKMVETYESSLPEPWQMGGKEEELLEKLVAQIVAFRIPLDRIEGKWKLNQNRPAEQRERVRDQLQSVPDDSSQAIAALMRESSS